MSREITSAEVGQRPIDNSLVASDDVARSTVQAKEGMSYQSLATMSDDDIANTHSDSMDPLRGHTRKERPGEFVISGQADLVFAKAGFAIGDKIYHKKRKKEGKVKDVTASGKVQVLFDDGDSGWMAKDNLVKL